MTLDSLKHMLDYIPFVTLMTGRPPPAPFVTRMLETAIMSVVAAAFATYVGVELLKKDVVDLKDGIEKVDQKVEKIDAKVEKIRSDLYRPIGGS